MKILLITGTFLPSTNGVAISTANLKKMLEEYGHKVLLLAPQNLNSERYKDSENVIRYASLDNPLTKDYPIPLFPLTLKIYQQIIKFKPELVHVQHPFHIGFFAFLISERLKIPLVFTYHTKYDHNAKKYFEFLPNKLKEKFVANSVTDFCKRVDLVIAPSKAIKNKLKKNNKDLKIVTVPSIIDDLRILTKEKKVLRNELKLPVNKKILLTVTRLVKEKNVELLIKSVSKLSKDFVLVICGTGPLEDNLKKLISKLKLENRIFMVGKIGRDMLGDYYQSADYFCFTSESETQGIIYWEAESFGLPIVSVNSDVAKEWVKPNFGLLSKKDPLILAEKIIELSRMNYKQISNNALSFSKNFTNKKSIDLMIEEYKKLIDK